MSQKNRQSALANSFQLFHSYLCHFYFLSIFSQLLRMMLLAVC